MTDILTAIITTAAGALVMLAVYWAFPGTGRYAVWIRRSDDNPTRFRTRNAAFRHAVSIVANSPSPVTVTVFDAWDNDAFIQLSWIRGGYPGTPRMHYVYTGGDFHRYRPIVEQQLRMAIGHSSQMLM